MVQSKQFLTFFSIEMTFSNVLTALAKIQFLLFIFVLLSIRNDAARYLNADWLIKAVKVKVKVKPCGLAFSLHCG